MDDPLWHYRRIIVETLMAFRGTECKGRNGRNGRSPPARSACVGFVLTTVGLFHLDLRFGIYVDNAYLNGTFVVEGFRLINSILLEI